MAQIPAWKKLVNQSAVVFALSLVSYIIYLSVPVDFLFPSHLYPDHRRLADPVEGGTDDHGDKTDDHAYGDDHGGGESPTSLFAIVTHLNINLGTISIIVVVAAVLCVEYLIHLLHELTFDTPFEHLVPNIEKELMIVGCTAFVLKVIVTTDSSQITYDWLHALEYADILVPMFSFSYCFIGMILIASSVRQCDIWGKSYHFKLLEMLDAYLDHTDHWFWRYVPSYFSVTMTEVEFRIFHNIFCDTFKIQRKEFAFNEYVQKISEIFIQNLLHIRLIDWFLLCILIVLNLARNKLGIVIIKCGYHDYHCYNRSAAALFTIAGAVVLVACFTVSIASRAIELKIMRIKGVPDRNNLHVYLEHMEETQDSQEQHVRMNFAALKTAVTAVRAQSLSRNAESFFVGKRKKAEELANRLSESVPDFIGSAPTTKTNRAGSTTLLKALSSRVKSFYRPIGSIAMSSGSRHKSVTTHNSVSLSVSSNASDENLSSAAPYEADDQSQAASITSDPDYIAKMNIHALNQQRKMQKSSSNAHLDSNKSTVSDPANNKDILDNASLDADVHDTNSTITPQKGIHAVILPPLITPLPHMLSPLDTLKESPSQEASDNHTPIHHEKKTPQHRVLDAPLRSSTGSLQEIPLLADDEDGGKNYPSVDEKEAEEKAEEEQVGQENRSVNSFQSGHHSTNSSQPSPSKNKPKPKPRVEYQRQTSMDSANSTKQANDHQMKNRAISIFSALNFIRTNLNYASNKNLLANQLPGDGASSGNDDSGGFPEAPLHRQMNRSASRSHNRRRSVIQSFLHVNNKPIYNNLDKTRDKEIDSAFLFSHPECYFDVVRGLIMFIALLWALFFTNFIAAAPNLLWIFLAFLPILLATMIYVAVVMRASLLMAVHSIDTDAMLEIIEQTEGSKQLGEQMRGKVLDRLREMGEPQAELYNLFREIDENGSGHLSRDEFATFMHAIDINFSRKKWQQIYREIDLNYDDKISFEEFFLFLFPNHDVGLALEKKRLKILGHRVKQKAQRRESKTSIKSKKNVNNPALVVPVDTHEVEQTGGNHTMRSKPQSADVRVNNIAVTVRHSAANNAPRNTTTGGNTTGTSNTILSPRISVRKAVTNAITSSVSPSNNGSLSNSGAL